MRARLFVVLLFFLFASAIAHADDSPTAKSAEALFSEARQLMHDNRFAEACPKLKASYTLDPGLGTLLNLGLCYEKEGRSASAWSTFRDAESAAVKKGDHDREVYARRRAESLEPKLARITIESSSLSGSILRDGVEQPETTWRAATPVDPGSHTIEARAEGKQPWSRTVVIRESERVTVAIPELVALPPTGVVERSSSRSSTTLPRDPMRSPSWRRPLALAIGGGAGGGALVVGTIAALAGLAAYDDSNLYCRDDACSRAGLEARDRAIGLADVATVSLIAAGVLIASGVVLWLTTTDPNRTPPPRQGSR